MADVHRKRYTIPLYSPRSYAVWMKTITNSLTFDTSDAAKFRLHVLTVYTNHGWRAACSAFGVSKTTLYRWKKRFEVSHHRLVALVPTSTRPKQVRRMVTDPKIVAFITAFRQQYGDKGKDVIKPFLDAYTTSLGIASVGPTTIGKIIKRKRLSFPGKKRSIRRRQMSITRLKRAPREQRPGYIEMDSVVVSVTGGRHCFISAIDVVTKTAMTKRVPTLRAVHAQAVIRMYMSQYPVHTVQTDNGSEFLGVCDDYLQEHGITHQWIYPRSPRINGVIERYNRTLQEEFLNRSDELFYDRVAFGEKLAQYLLWYNTKRPHHSLKLMTPVEYYHQLTHSPICM